MNSFYFECPSYVTPTQTALPVSVDLSATPIAAYISNAASTAEENPGSVRRQNRSCDQCRKGKRRCDAIVLRDWPNEGRDTLSSETQHIDRDSLNQQTPNPCSYCSKTKKICTFEWLKSQEPALKAKKEPRGNEQTRPFKKSRLEKPAATPHWSNSPRNASSSSPSDTYSSIESFKETASLVYSHAQWQDEMLANSSSEAHATYHYHMALPATQDVPVNAGPYSDFSYHPSIPFVNSDPTFLPSELISAPLENRDQPPSGDISFLYPRPKRSLTYGDASDMSEGQETEQPEIKCVEFLFDPSPYSLPERLVLSTNHTLMSESLMKIYHDSMENALSCWLNERTCPYRYKPNLITNGQADSTQHSLQQAWAEDWPNRIFRRVFALDRMAGKLRNKPLTKSEENAASKALYLVIMAFATQWAQASKRSREEHHATVGEGQRATSSNSHAEATHTSMNDEPEFDRKLQEIYWREARKALLDCADIESFKVAFANIVFSLIQKPMSMEQQEEFMRGSASTMGTFGDSEDFKDLDEQVQRVIDEEGPPIYLEQGVRHAHSLRHKLQRREREMARASGTPGKKVLSEEDRTTVDLIAWLGYMLESLTSAMHQRPLVVSDEDCDVLPESIQALNLSDDETVPKKPGASRLWNDYFFLQERSNRKGAPLRYPCTYDQAAAGLTDAAPIKVLLYRKVTLLQTLLARGNHPEKIEEAIRDSIHIYDHWKVMYEPFIKDCIENHDHLHPRIQTWYICVTAHWHLATLLLADAIESIDNADLGRDSYRESRKSSDLVGTLRRHNAHMVSDLARCATPREEGSFQHSRHFHFALNAGALLTEPWTAILIRVFSKAAILLMQEACSPTTPGPKGIPQSQVSDAWQTEQVARQCEDCVRALKYLGKKSDTARLAGDTLTQALYSKMRLWSRADLELIPDGGAEWLAEADGLDDMAMFARDEPSMNLSGFS